jgi:dethiobiotin synthetase
MAADALGLAPFTIAELVGEIAPAADAAITFIEGAGGPRSPMASDGDNVALAAAVAADVVVLVAPAGLGTINAVRLSVDAWRDGPGAGTRLVVALNRYDAGDDLHRRNHGWLAGDDLHLVLRPAELAGVLLG